MDLLLLFRFHFLPWARSWAEAARRGPLVFGVAGFVIVFLVGLTAAGKPVLVLPEGGQIVFAAAVITGLAALLWRASSSGRWRLFFQARPRGHRARVVYLSARSLGAWAAASAVVWGLSGQGLVVAAVAVAALPFTAATVAIGLGASPERSGSMGALRLPWLPAWWVSRPLLFVVPAVAWLSLMLWALSGQAGFVWADRPPVVGMLLDFGWPTVFGLLWTESASQLPLSFFRQARAPFRRVLAVVGVPVAAVTAVVLVLVAVWAWPSDVVRAVVLTATGTAFCFAFWLRSGSATLAHVALFATLTLVGVALERDWWLVWAAAQAGGAVLALAGWRTRYYEGESHAGN